MKIFEEITKNKTVLIVSTRVMNVNDGNKENVYLFIVTKKNLVKISYLGCKIYKRSGSTN